MRVCVCNLQCYIVLPNHNAFWWEQRLKRTPTSTHCQAFNSFTICNIVGWWKSPLCLFCRSLFLQSVMSRVPQQKSDNPPKIYTSRRTEEEHLSLRAWNWVNPMWLRCNMSVQLHNSFLEMRLRLKSQQVEKRIETGCKTKGAERNNTFILNWFLMFVV